MIPPDEVDDCHDMSNELGELICKWACDGKSVNNVLATIFISYCRTIACTDLSEEKFFSVFSPANIKRTWETITKNRKEISENKH